MNPGRRSAAGGALVFGLALACLIQTGAGLWAADAITNCAAVRRLSGAEAKRRLPVRFEGVVSLYEPLSQLCFVQDETAGIYAMPVRWAADLRAGDRVEVEALTDTGRFSPILCEAVFRIKSRGLPPAAKPVPIEEVNAGLHDAQWVEVSGVIQSVENEDTVPGFRLQNAGSRTTVLLFARSPSSTNLVNAFVRLRGVAGTFFDQARLTGFGVFMGSPEDITVVRPGGDPFDRTIRPIDQPVAYREGESLDDRVRIRGTVLVDWGPEGIFVKDSSGAMRLVPAKGASFAPGDEIEAVGFVRDPVGLPYLGSALVRLTGRAGLSPTALNLDDLFNASQPAFGEIEGILRAATNGSNSVCLTVESKGRFLSAFCPLPAPEAPLGARIRLAGVWSAPPAEWRGQCGPGLWLHSAASATILSAPASAASAFARVGPFRSIAAACAAIAAVFGVLAWSQARAARAAHRENALAHESLAEAQAELQKLNSARERLGRDLHDHIMQSIYGVGLNLDDCAQQLQTDPRQVEPRLKNALKEINGVIRELRNVVLGLETDAIEPREFRTALKSLSLALGQEKSSLVRLDIDEEAMKALTPLQATELVHIAREALSNSLRHGRAQTMIFGLKSSSLQVRFSIEDDGIGFDPKADDGSGFGLRNMAKRAENLRATLTINAEPGAGTRIVLDIPRQKQHFSNGESSSRSHS